MLEDEIRQLRTRFWSDRDPAGRAFAPLADAYRRTGELDEATDLVEEGTDRLPDFAPGHLVRARVLRDRGDEEGARRAYRRVLELDPENVDALREAAAMAEDADRTVEAVELWHRLARLQPADERPRRHIRELKRRSFQVEAAVVAEGEDGELSGGPEPGRPEPERPEPAGPEPEEPEPPEVPARAVGAEAGEEDEGGTEVYTRTMAELYARQGFQERAVEVYRRLVEERPDDTDLRARLEELERRSGAGASDTDESAVGPPPETPDAADASEAPPEEGDVETLAREWAAGPGATGELSTPFAWGGEGEGDSEPESAARPSIASYFQRMLEWPAERDDEAQESPEEEIVPIEALAPDPVSETPDLEGRYLGAEAPPDDPAHREEQP